MKRVLLACVWLLLPATIRAAEVPAEVEVLVVYHSVTGHTETLAREVAAGARAVEGVEVVLETIDEATTDDVLRAEAIILGSPVHNGNPAPEVLRFVNGWPFRDAPLRDKIGAAFVAAGGISAGEEAAQLALLRSMLCFGMITVGGPHWTGAFGASAITHEPPFEVDEADGRMEDLFLHKARDLGGRVAELARRLHGRGDLPDAPAASEEEAVSLPPGRER